MCGEPVTQETEERRDPGTGADQDHVLGRIGTGPERLPGRVHARPDHLSGLDCREVVGRDTFERAATGTGRRIQHTDDQSYRAG